MPLTEEKLVTALKGKYNSGEITKVQFAQALKKFRSQQTQTPQQAPAQPRVDKWGVEMPENFMTELPELPPAPTFKEEIRGVWDKVKKLYQGTTSEEVEKLPGTFGMQMGESMTDPAAWARATKASLGTMTTPIEETAQIIVANMPGKNPETGREASYRMVGGDAVIYNPYTNQEHAVKTGFRAEDIPRILGTLGVDALLTKGMGLLGSLGRAGSLGKTAQKVTERVPDASSLTGVMGREAGLEATRQTGEAAVGGEFDLADVGGATAAAGLMRLAGKTAEGALKEYGYPKLIESAKQGNPNAVNMLNDLKASDPAGYKNAMDAVGVEGFDPATGAIKFQDKNIDDLFFELSQSKNPDAWAVAAAAKNNPKLIAALRRTGMIDLLTTDKLVDPEAAGGRAKTLFDSAAPWGFNIQLDENMTQLNKRFGELMDKAGRDGAGATSDMIKDVMERKRDVFKADADRVWSQIRAQMPKDARGEAKNTVEYIRGRMDELGGGDMDLGYEALSSLEKRILKFLDPATASKIDPKLTGFDKIQAEAASRLQKPTWKQIDTFKREVGSTMKAGGYSDESAAQASTLYDKLKTDTIDSVNKMDIDDRLKEKILSVGNLTVSQKNMENKLEFLFGKKIKHALEEVDTDMVGKTVLATNKALKDQLGDFKSAINIVEKEQRPQFITSALLNSVKDDNGQIQFKDFAKLNWAMDADRGLRKIVEANVPKESVQIMDDLGEIAKAIYAKPRKGASVDVVRKTVAAKEGLLRQLMNAGARFGTTLGIAGLGPGQGTAVLGLTAGSAVKNALEPGDENVQRFLEFLHSDAVKKAMASDLSDRPIKELSKSEAADRFFKQFTDAKSTADIELFIRSAMRGEEDSE